MCYPPPPPPPPPPSTHVQNELFAFYASMYILRIICDVLIAQRRCCRINLIFLFLQENRYHQTKKRNRMAIAIEHSGRKCLNQAMEKLKRSTHIQLCARNQYITISLRVRLRTARTAFALWRSSAQYQVSALDSAHPSFHKRAIHATLTPAACTHPSHSHLAHPRRKTHSAPPNAKASHRLIPPSMTRAAAAATAAGRSAPGAPPGA